MAREVSGTKFSGVWLPVITPFTEGEIDYAGYERLVDHYVRAGVAGVIPLGTTGESPTVDEAEAEALVERTVEVVAGRVPIVVGVEGNDTRKVVKGVKRLDRHGVGGLLCVCPYYSRPSQDGMREHFIRIAEATDRPILIYNIPYRTGVNLENDTLLALAEVPHIAGVKDSSGNIAQSLELLRRRPEGFAVLTGEDAYFYTMLAHGADGGILASAHIEAGRLLAVYQRIVANDHQGARAVWATLETLVPLLFREPNPMPIKHCLWRQGLIQSPECRRPLTRVSERLGRELDRELDRVANRVGSAAA
jgi:4-hydroxy-tetrahydrodipicolinate synthase